MPEERQPADAETMAPEQTEETSGRIKKRQLDKDETPERADTARGSEPPTRSASGHRN